jgi:hypothetical protein
MRFVILFFRLIITPAGLRHCTMFASLSWNLQANSKSSRLSLLNKYRLRSLKDKWFVNYLVYQPIFITIE